MDGSIMSTDIIFPKGNKVESPVFIGTAWLQMLVPEDKVLNTSIYNVTFESRARNNWHIHPGGQILLVTEGRGYYQEEGRTARVIQKGDVVKIAPGIKHWHGAGPDTQLIHLGITTNPEKGEAEWLEAVTDEEYNKL